VLSDADYQNSKESERSLIVQPSHLSSINVVVASQVEVLFYVVDPVQKIGQEHVVQHLDDANSKYRWTVRELELLSAGK